MENKNTTLPHKRSLLTVALYTVFYVGVCFTAVFVVLEVGLRIILADELNTKKLFTVDEHGDYVYLPNIDEQIFNGESGKSVRFKTNNTGFIGESPGNSKIKVAVLGDSYVAAREVDYGKSFTALLGSRLTSANPGSLVGNYGIGGQGTVEQMRRYDHYIEELKPEAVVLVFFPNDIENNSHYLSRRDVILGEPSGWQNVTLAYGNFNPRNDIKQSIRERFVTVRKAEQVVRELFKKDNTTGDILISTTDSLFVTPLSERGEEAVIFTAELIQKLKQRVESRGSKFVMVYLPYALEVDQRVLSGLQHENQTYAAATFNTDQIRSRLLEVLREADVDVLDLQPYFKNFIQVTDENLYFRDIGHLNEVGHQLVASELSSYLAPILTAED